MLHYSKDQKITTHQFRDLLIRSTLGERRPVNDQALLEGMISNADLLIGCWQGDLLVGIARSVTDFHYCCYLSDLAVDTTYQKQGIGKQLITETRQALGPQCKIILLAAPEAKDYYPHIGFQKHDQAWVLAT